ncbi:MAG TPA: sigma-70 family RNA polymerase sigma factor [Planctomycetota bacterium]|nr:sigma-70 family RNA polymerase sigma factor [Planctomycetota bacterium]
MVKGVPARTSRSDQTDEKLVGTFVEGRIEAFEELIRRYQSKIVNFIYRSIGDFQRAEELAQETFMRVFRMGSRFDPRYRFSTWIYTIAKNLSSNELRDRSRDPESYNIREADWPQDSTFVAELVSSGTHEPHQILTSREMKASLEKAMSKLGPDLRMALVMKEFDHMTYVQIAEVFNTSAGTVKSWLYRAKRQLSGTLKESEVF